MKTGIALIALLVLSSVAGAGEEDAVGREALAVRAAMQKEAAGVARDAARVRADAHRLELQRVQWQGAGGARTETTVVAPRQARLELESFDGMILVSGWDRNTVRVVADHAPGTHVGVTVQAAAVLVEAQARLSVPGLKSGRHPRTVSLPAHVDYRLTVPRDMSLRLSGVDAEIRVEGVTSDVSAETVSGPVTVHGGRGAVRVSAINGAVEIVGARGRVEASSMNDDVVLRDIEGPVRVETVRGNLDLAGVLSDAVEASTVSGNLRYEGSMRPGGEYRFETHSGDVTVVLPVHPDAAVTVETYAGSFQSDFPLPVKQPRLDGEFEFRLGDGRAELKLSSFSGAIRLLRAGEAARPARPAPKTR